MSKKKIAICISGQSRFWQNHVENFHGFFDASLADYSIFLHYWKDPMDQSINETVFRNYFNNIKKIIIDDIDSVFAKKPPLDTSDTELILPQDQSVSELEKAVFRKYPTAWLSILYGNMITNFMKKDHELENDMQFDVVVSAHLDNIYPQNNDKFTRCLDHVIHREIYANTMICEMEYNLPGVNTGFYYGNSETMDMVDALYNAYQSSDFFTMMGANGRDPAYKLVGPRVLLYKWMTHKNITIKQNQYLVTKMNVNAGSDDKSISDGF